MGAYQQRGFGMVEVLVATVLLSIGLLGLASLQTYSIQRSTSSAQRVAAVELGYDLLDRMRANRAQAIAGRYDVQIGTTPTASDLATADVLQWKARLAEALPDGDGSVLVENQIATITVTWTDTARVDTGGGSGGAFNLRTQL